MKFSEMPYERVDFEQVEKDLVVDLQDLHQEQHVDLILEVKKEIYLKILAK